jgi:diguanylate cyclase (GGDEF)-like protein/hemerythrin-like metal-binding protein/PAS domain S-box-containing protein
VIVFLRFLFPSTFDRKKYQKFIFHWALSIGHHTSIAKHGTRIQRSSRRPLSAGNIMPTTDALTDQSQIFPWSDKFSTGIDLIDEQHQVLVALLNKLAMHMSTGSDDLTLGAVYDELTDYTIYHFNAEEGIWGQYFGEDPLATKHYATHKDFVAEVARLRSKLFSFEREQEFEEVVSFLTQWLAFHILETDAYMAQIVLSLRNGMAMSEAKQVAGQRLQGATHVLIEAVLQMFTGLSNRTLALQREISQRRAAEAKLRLANDIIENSADAIFITNAQGLITDANRAFLQDVKRSREALLGQPIATVKAALFADQGKDIWAAATRSGHWAGEVSTRRPDGSQETVWLTLSTVKDEAQADLHYVGMVSSISQLVERHHALEAAANFDALTGLPNRRLLTDRLDQCIERSKRSGSLLAVCFMDLDGFKKVNDTHGHDAGDAVLKVVAERLTQTLRGADTVARLGGDEFVLLLGDLSHAQEATGLLERVLREVSQPIDLPAQQVQVGISIGVTLYPDDAAGPDELLKHADLALYQAKTNGKGRIWTYDLAGGMLIS